MAASQRRKKKKGGRKLEFAIYIVAVILICLMVLGTVKLAKLVIGTANGNTTTTSSQYDVLSTVSSEPSRPAPSQVEGTVSQEESSEESSKQPVAPKGDYITYTKSGVEELDEWYLRLVNGTSTLDSEFKTGMTDVGGEQLDSRIVKAYRDMCSAASADGVNIYAISGYRSYATQKRLYNNRVERAKRENPNFTQAQAEAYAATHVARPGTSEHQSGLAIDFNSVETSFGSTEAGKWLKANAEDYGFILRYEKDKQGLTGVTWEPWHYRFVGVKHAKRMNELGYCMEEYVEHIRKGGQ